MHVHYDAKSYHINGKQVFLNSAAIHYFRMPKEEWREVLVKAKLAGMNCIDTYFAWNVHEPEEGNWVFEGDQDCGEFLDLCAELGLWVIARPGPFICAEWDFGGFPWWLSNKEGISFRSYSRPYLDYVDRYFDNIIPIIRDRQLTNGGTVILVQVENEYEYLLDDASAADYMNYLRDGLIRRGIEVPLITCVGGAEGTIEGANFWSNADKHYQALREKQPDTPKIVTEFWTGWFEHWGASAATQKTACLYEKRMMEVLRAGFSGINHYMFYGGTNFGSYGGRTLSGSDTFMVTSYDYDAPLNEYGRITPKYAAAKKLTYFIRSLEELLLNADDAIYINGGISEGYRASYRERVHERVWFVESDKEERETAFLTLGSGQVVPVTVHPRAITPVIEQLQIKPDVFLSVNTYLICNEDIDGMRTLIISADNGARSWIEIEASEQIQLVSEAGLPTKQSEDGKRLTIDGFHFQEAGVILFTIGAEKFRLILVNEEMTDSAWRVEDQTGVRWALGYKDMNLLVDDGVHAALSRSGNEVLLLGSWQRPELHHVVPYVALTEPELELYQSMSISLIPTDSSVRADQPMDFSEMLKPYGYLLYTYDLEAGEEVERSIVISQLQDTCRVYVNGQEQQLIRQVGAAWVKLKLLPCQRNRIQLLVQHMGRLNFSPYLGEFKGVKGPIYLDGSSIDMREGWECGEEPLHLGHVCTVESGALIRRTFQIESQNRAILVGSMSGRLKINGQLIEIEGYQNWFLFHTLDISDYIHEGLNEIEMEYIQSPIARLELLTCHTDHELKGWYIQDVDQLEQSLIQDQQYGNAPVLHRFQFNKPQLPQDSNAKLKLRLTGMSKGFIRLNGRELGRYWTIGPQEDYKIPLAWLSEHNELELFDEEGNDPSQVKLLFDADSTHRWIAMK